MTDELLEKKEALFDYVNELYQTSLDLENYFDSENDQKSVQKLLKTFIHELENDESNNEQFLEDMSTKLLVEIVPVIDQLSEQKDIVKLVVKEEEKLKTEQTENEETEEESESEYSTDNIPMSQRTIKYDFSDWVNFVFEMKERGNNFVDLLPSSYQYQFRVRLSNITVPKNEEESELIYSFSIFALELADCSLKILHHLVSFVLEAQNQKNIFFTHSIDLSHQLEDNKEYIESKMKKLQKKYSQTNLNHSIRHDKFFERRNIWIFVLTTMDEIEDRIEKLHEYYYEYYYKTIKNLLEKVDSNIFWVQRGLTQDKNAVIEKLIVMWKKNVKNYLEKDEDLRSPQTVVLPMSLKDVWRDVSKFEKKFSLHKNKRF
eukprot:gene5154-8760_t